MRRKNRHAGWHRLHSLREDNALQPSGLTSSLLQTGALAEPSCKGVLQEEARSVIIHLSRQSFKAIHIEDLNERAPDHADQLLLAKLGQAAANRLDGGPQQIPDVGPCHRDRKKA